MKSVEDKRRFFSVYECRHTIWFNKGDKEAYMRVASIKLEREANLAKLYYWTNTNNDKFNVQTTVLETVHTEDEPGEQVGAKLVLLLDKFIQTHGLKYYLEENKTKDWSDLDNYRQRWEMFL